MELDNIIMMIYSAIISGVVGFLFRALKNSYDRLIHLESNSSAMLLALGQASICHAHRTYTKQKFISAHDLEAMTKIYEAYHALGGNGTITTLFNEIKSLPIKND